MINLFNVLLRPLKAERHPLEMVLVGFVYTSLSIVLSMWLFTSSASLAMVFLTVLSCSFVIQKALIVEEKVEKKEISTQHRWKFHFRTLRLLTALFIGFCLAFVLWTIILPLHLTSQTFSLQQASVERIQSLTGSSIQSASLWAILSNNLKVFAFSIIFAIFYGAGAIFILAWNASVMGFVIGNLAKETWGLSALPMLFTRYFLHGLPEMIAYFGGALAGGILFIALVKGDLYTSKGKKILFDIVALIIASLLILVLAAFLEVYVSPLI